MNRTLLLTALLGTLSAALPCQAATLYHTFTFGNTRTDYTFSLLGSGGWTVGSVGGPLATDADFQDVLGGVTDFRLGGIGIAAPGTNGNATAGFGLFAPSLAGLVSDPNFQSGPGFCNGWTNTGNLPEGCSAASVNGFSSVFSSTRVDFIAPDKYWGDLSAAFGGDLTFGFIAVANAPASYQFGSGVVALSGQSATPEPASLSLVAAALVGAGVARRRRRG